MNKITKNKQLRQLSDMTDRQIWNLYKLIYNDGVGYWVTRAWQGSDNRYNEFVSSIKSFNKILIPHHICPSKLLEIYNWLKTHKYDVYTK